MTKSSKNYKESSSKENGKAIRYAERRNHKNDKFKIFEDAKPKIGSSTRASMVGRTSNSKRNKLNKKKYPVEDYDLDDDDDEGCMPFLRMSGFHPNVV